MTDGLLDTNVFIHAHATDRFSDECRRFLFAVEQGEVPAHLEPLILHELSYALPHYVKQMTRAQVAEYLLMVLSWKGVQGDKDLMVDAVERWRSTSGLSFTDAYLAALARRRQCAVYTKNVREFEGQGVAVPQPLPSEAIAPDASHQSP
jgi:predicted nucleic acid-binding protein